MHNVDPTTPPPRVYRSLATRMAPRQRATTEMPISLQRTPQPTPLPSRPNRTHSTFLPAALYKIPSILTHRLPRTQNPSSGAAPRVGAASPALPYGGGAQSNANQDVSMPGTSDRGSRARTNIRPSPPRGGGAARPPVRGRAHADQSKRPSQRPVSCWLAGVRRGVGGHLVAGDVARGRVVSECQ